MHITIESDKPITRLTTDLSNSIWQVLVYSAPYDTGNLRSAIRKSADTNTRTLFIYDENQARYLDFLERGVGPVRKYKGFISQKSLNEATKEIVYWAKTGNTTFSGVPTVVLLGRNKKRSRDGVGGKPIGYEKSMIKDVELYLTAKERSTLSRMYVKQKFGELFDVKGQKVNVEVSPFSARATNIKKGI